MVCFYSSVILSRPVSIKIPSLLQNEQGLTVENYNHKCQEPRVSVYQVYIFDDSRGEVRTGATGHSESEVTGEEQPRFPRSGWHVDR